MPCLTEPPHRYLLEQWLEQRAHEARATREALEKQRMDKLMARNAKARAKKPRKIVGMSVLIATPLPRMQSYSP